MKAVFDTNIIIDYLNGVKKAKKEIELFDEKFISIITYCEVLIGIKEIAEKNQIENFLKKFNIIEINLEIANLAIEIRQETKMKLPDSLILASAFFVDGLMISRDFKDFSKKIPIIRHPYKI